MKAPSPLVAAFLRESAELSDLILQSGPPRDGVERSLRAMALAVQAKLPVDQALQEARRIALPRLDPELRVLVLSIWGQLLCQRRQGSEASALLRRAGNELPPNPRPEFLSLLLLGDAAVAATEGALHVAEKHLRQAIAMTPVTSPHHLVSLVELGLHLALQGRLADLDEDRAAKPLDQGESRALRSRLRFIDDVTCGRIPEACERLAEIDAVPLEGRATLTAALVRHRRILEFLVAARANIPGSSPVSPAESTDVQILKSLLDGQLRTALDRARVHSTRTSDFLVGSDLLSFNLIRAELACGNGEAARHAIEVRSERGNHHYMDNFYYARVAVLSGNWEVAAGEFAQALRACDRYKALGRLDLELSMARELAPGALVQLTRSAQQLVTSVPEPQPKARDAAPGTAFAGVARLVGRSEPLAKLKDRIVRFASLDATVLITGETGSGKELVARALHESGTRARQPFVAVNCGAIPEPLLESELFGHTQGAFTGATTAHRGLFEEAGAGTIFLDEIGDMPPRLQVLLLRLLESGELRPVGSGKVRQIACRIVAATNSSLVQQAADGTFRKDLLYRLRRLEVYIPPLRERRDDILPLVNHFLTFGRQDGFRPAITPRLKELLMSHGWPGNVRQVRNIVERMRLLRPEEAVYDIDDLDEELLSGERLVTEVPLELPRSIMPEVDHVIRDRGVNDQQITDYLKNQQSPLRRLERLRALFTAHGRLTRAEVAHILNISEQTATRDLKQLREEGWVEKVKPNAAPRTHYFIRARPPGG